MSQDKDVFTELPGGSDLIAWFGFVPDFHDAEIIELSLHCRAPSILKTHTWETTSDVDEQRRAVLTKHVVVTFTLEGILDLQLDGFSRQNVIGELILRAVPDRPDRRPMYDFAPSPTDIEIELRPCYGLDGRIRCQKVRIDLTPGKPHDASDTD